MEQFGIKSGVSFTHEDLVNAVGDRRASILEGYTNNIIEHVEQCRNEHMITFKDLRSTLISEIANSRFINFVQTDI